MSYLSGNDLDFCGAFMKIKTALCALAAALALSSPSAFAYKVGISLPTQNDQRWYKEGPEIAAALQKAGFETDLYYSGDGDIAIQQRHMERMVKEHCDAMIVTPVDSSGLKNALDSALKANIPVIAYDRLILGTKAVQYYVAFDSKDAGRIQARAISRALHLDSRNPAYPVNAEFFAGSTDDRNALLQWEGFMEVMQPFIDKKVLNVPSGDVSMGRASIFKWSTDQALKRMDKLIGLNNYGPGKGKTKLKAVFCASDGLADGVILALRKAGYTKDDMPYITGMDAQLSQVRGIVSRERNMTVLKDPRLLYPILVEMITDLSQGKTPKTNDDHTFANGKKIVPARVLSPKLVDRSNVKTMLIESGIYTAKDVGLEK